MWFDIDPRLSTPVYQQIIEKIKKAIAHGLLEPGEKIPTVRELASLTALNPNTIAKAYQKLEQEGVIITMRSRGTFVADTNLDKKTAASYKALEEMLENLLIDAYHMGFSHTEVQNILNQKLIEWEKGRGK